MTFRAAARHGVRGIGILVAIALVACQSTASPDPTPTSHSTAASSAATPSPSAAPSRQPPDLSQRPLVWFAPLPPQRGGPYDGSDDWLSLWDPGADWEQLAGGIGVYKLYGGWIAAESTTGQLERVGATLDGHHIAIAAEMGPLFPSDDCGQDIEGFSGGQAQELVDNLVRAGVTLDIVALDEPWYYAHVYDGPQACHWSNERIAAGVARFAAILRAAFPDLLIGDIEPLPEPVDAAGLAGWIDAWTDAMGEPPAFLHLDPDYGRAGWPQLIGQIGAEAHARDVPYGVIAFGEPYDATDLAWLQHSGQRLNRLRILAGVEPDHVIFQSWQDHPDRALPESDPETYTGWLRTYLADPTSTAAVGPPNHAAASSIQASSEVPGYPASNVGDASGAHWNAADGAPGWVQLALAAPSAVARINLVVAQDPAGQSVHELWIRRTGGELQRVQAYAGVTAEGDVLTWQPAQPLTDVDLVRVVTVSLAGGLAPAWHEIEILGPG